MLDIAGGQARLMASAHHKAVLNYNHVHATCAHVQSKHSFTIGVHAVHDTRGSGGRESGGNDALTQLFL